MYTSLGPEAIGVRGLALRDAIALARDSGFAGLTFDIRVAAQAVEDHGLDEVRGWFSAANVLPANWGLPVSWRDDARFADDLQKLAPLAAVGRELGSTRTATFMPSGSNEREFDENFAWHISRLRPIAELLREEGCRLGIEYIGTATWRAQFPHEFIYTLPGLMDLIAAIDVDNVGVMVDSWHLFSAGGTVEELERLTNRDVVVAHVNDAPAGIGWDEQIDTQRALPLETGVLDLVGFMQALQRIGYDGPVMPEPFSQRVNELAATDPLAAARETERSMDALWQAAGLS
jgi:sugar phosphate isomerase/epimerase